MGTKVAAFPFFPFSFNYQSQQSISSINKKDSGDNKYMDPIVDENK
jgi:hypothetical protein